MTPPELRRIVKQRFTDWLEVLTEVHATPIVLIAVGHDDRRGECHVLTLEGLPADTDLASFVAAALEKIKRGDVG